VQLWFTSNEFLHRHMFRRLPMLLYSKAWLRSGSPACRQRRLLNHVGSAMPCGRILLRSGPGANRHIHRNVRFRHGRRMGHSFSPDNGRATPLRALVENGRCDPRVTRLSQGSG